MRRNKKEEEVKKYKIALWYDVKEKIELTITGWEVNSGFLYLTSEIEVRAMSTDRIREFTVKDKTEEKLK